jgi:hypothetical protein
MATAQEHKAAIESAIEAFHAAQAEAAARVEAAKAKVRQLAEGAATEHNLAEGEIRSLAGDVPVLVKKDGRVKYEIIKGLSDGGSK